LLRRDYLGLLGIPRVEVHDQRQVLNALVYIWSSDKKIEKALTITMFHEVDLHRSSGPEDVLKFLLKPCTHVSQLSEPIDKSIVNIEVQRCSGIPSNPLCTVVKTSKAKRLSHAIVLLERMSLIKQQCWWFGDNLKKYVRVLMETVAFVEIFQ
jgi:hypothetical protein